MNTFNLDRDKGLWYTISANGNHLATRNFTNEVYAILWAKNYISSWTKATLTINFKTIGENNVRQR